MKIQQLTERANRTIQHTSLQNEMQFLTVQYKIIMNLNLLFYNNNIICIAPFL